MAEAAAQAAEARLESACSGGNPGNAAQLAKEAMTELVSSVNGASGTAEEEAATAGVAAAVRYLVRDAVALGVSRPALEQLAEDLHSLPGDKVETVAQETLRALAERRSVFEEVEAKIRELLGAVLAEKELYVDAARVLSAINMEDARHSDAQKAEQYVRITELFLEADETVEAERFVNRASQYIYTCDPLVQVRHKVSYARILDAKRRFLDAAHRYYKLSSESAMVDGKTVAEEDLMHLLSKSVTCAILASAGPQRQRMLNLLYKDERSRTLTTSWMVLEKMYMQRILTNAEIAVFEQQLEPHQKAILADGSTVLERAVLEHNVLAATKIYANVSFAELAKLLNIEQTRAESVASTMIKEKRMQGTIDQVDGVLDFAAEEDDPLISFDARIQHLCHAVNGVLDQIEKTHPGFVAQ
ncbi:COP9 signalosome complex subunit 4 [Hondaea fermentalgiana]|uniref:COP9 signalosome complex subunit 4 n=1 Tax=Hondaea fermentalgiana TaxID=2315210 RepID=A0A2R5GAA6_9STRA|nr:COP9 signalosome complex subunit 4 [Hondaea fermentalgiana]|eukprot:GBG27950.1 COP9 signalosome complex subunit 4 [Hondaea fermentalgiana]